MLIDPVGEKIVKPLCALLLVPLLTMLGSLGGCGGTSGGGDGGDVEAGSGSGDVPDDAFQSLDAVRTVVATSLNVAAGLIVAPSELPASAVSQHVHCSNGSQASVTGSEDTSVSPGSFNLAVEMNGCEGVLGSLTFTGTSTTTTEEITFEGGFSGTVGGLGCLMTLDDLSYTFSVDREMIAAPTSETVTGNLSGDCSEPAGTATISCDFGTGIDPEETASFSTSCSCTGDGC